MEKTRGGRRRHAGKSQGALKRRSSGRGSRRSPGFRDDVWEKPPIDRSSKSREQTRGKGRKYVGEEGYNGESGKNKQGLWD